MTHGGYDKRRPSAGNRRGSKGLQVEKRPKSLSVKNQKKKPKTVSLKNQIRSTERILRKNLPAEVKEAQEKKLEELKKQQETQNRLAIERQIFLRDRKIRFFERRKIERRIRRAEKLHRTSADHNQETNIGDQLSKLKEDLEYVRFFPKTEKYVSLFIGGDDADIVDKRNRLREKIKANIITAAASGKDLEETGSEDDGLLEVSEDDFFASGSSSDEADADDELTDKSAREQASSASGKATSGMSSDEKNQRQVSARALMPPPRPSTNSVRGPNRNQTRPGSSSSNKPPMRNQLSMSKNASHSRSEASFQNRGSSSAISGHSSNLSSNSDAHKPRRKRRPKKKKQQT